MEDRISIDLEDINTWPSNFCEELWKNKELIVSYHQEKIRVDRMAKDDLFVRSNPPDNIHEDNYNLFVGMLEKIVCGRSIVVYHCTRLTSYEIEDIKKNGLRMLTPDLVKTRIERATENSLLGQDECSYLLHSEHIRNNLSESVGKRLNMIFFCSAKSVLKNERGVGRFFRCWGGEAIYMGHEDDPTISHRLRTIGKPCIIKCAVPFSDTGRIHAGLVQCMISYFILNNNLSSFESRVGNLIENVNIYSPGSTRDDFIKSIGLNMTEMNQSNIPYVSMKIKEYMINNSDPIEESHADIEEIIQNFFKTSTVDVAEQTALKDYESNLSVEPYYQFDVIIKRNISPEELVDVIDIDHEDFFKLTECKK